MKTIAFLNREVNQLVNKEVNQISHPEWGVGYANGYVAVPPGHPLHGTDGDIVEEWTSISVWGGLTFSEYKETVNHWDRQWIEMLDGGSFDDIPGDWFIFGFDTMHLHEKLHDREWCIRETRRLQQQIEAVKKLGMVIELTKDTMCAHDEHEITKYPRPWFKAKPLLKAGTRLKVEERWSNFYGTYYRCETEDGLYDIPVNYAIIVKEE